MIPSLFSLRFAFQVVSGLLLTNIYFVLLFLVLFYWEPVGSLLIGLEQLNWASKIILTKSLKKN